jgi:hypothetical protein
MKLLWLAGLLVACGPGIHQTPETFPTHGFATTFADASRSGDVATLRKMMGPEVTVGGLWFPDPTCQQEFAGGGEIGGGRLDELARCLTTVKLSVSSRKDSLVDVAVLTYEPGMEIEARFIDRPTGPWLSWIGYEARKDVGDALPTITPETLESLRTAGQRDPAIPGVTNEPTTAIYAWVKTCIDGEGKVTGTHVREASTPAAARLFLAAIADWSFKPFAPAGQPLPVCSLVVLGKPFADVVKSAEIPMPTRMPDNKLMMISPHSLHRISGNRLVVPDDKTKTAIHNAGISRVVGTYQFCINEAGHIGDLAMLRSTGVPPYDAEILREISHWEYAPYVDEGKVIPVCTAVTFVYTQS